jgi:hypothetical protein
VDHDAADIALPWTRDYDLTTQRDVLNQLVAAPLSYCRRSLAGDDMPRWWLLVHDARANQGPRERNLMR